MYACFVLRELINPLLRLEFVNHRCIAVTERAQLRNSPTAGPAHKSARRIHGPLQVICIWIAAMTIVTSESAVRMDIVGELLGRSLQIALEDGMALETTILRSHGQP